MGGGGLGMLVVVVVVVVVCCAFGMGRNGVGMRSLDVGACCTITFLYCGILSDFVGAYSFLKLCRRIPFFSKHGALPAPTSYLA